MLKIYFIIFIISFNNCFTEEIILNKIVSEERFEIKLNEIKREFQVKFDELNYKVIQLQEQNCGELNACGNGWIKYSDKKCFKVLNKKGTIFFAKSSCNKMNSTLITIQTEEEQLFVTNILKKYNITDNVWIGLEMNENKTYKWMDGNDLKYDNWDENSDKNKKYVEMSIPFGKWNDQVYSKINNIICQKDQTSDLGQQLKNLTKTVKNFGQEVQKHHYLIDENSYGIKEMEKQIINLNKTTNTIDVPINFIYIQLPDQYLPEDLWPNTYWTEITPQYSGLFFRAEGGESETFGNIQQANQSWISNVFLADCHYKEWHKGDLNCDYTHTSLRQENWIEIVRQNRWYRFPNSIKFYSTGGEVRPKNTAIKIFKRIE